MARARPWAIMGAMADNASPNGAAVLNVAQAIAAGLVLQRLSAGRRRAAPLEPVPVPPGVRVSVVVPARDEAERIGPCLAGIRDAFEVLVVDDRSSDGTADVARATGARVVEGREPPPGWVGKPWALQQGLEAATGDVVVSLDADTRPQPGLLGALAGALEDADWVTAGPRFVCDTPGEQLLHPSLLASLVFRFGPQDVPAPRRLVANGQCTAARRDALLAAGGYRHSASHMTDDVAQARGLAAAGRRVAFRDGSAVLEVKMHASAAELWREWGRSIALADVSTPAERAGDVAVVWLTMALPLLRRRTPVDRLLLVVRAALLAGLAGSYVRPGPAFWLSPLADPLTALRLTLSAARPPREWKGRSYDAGGRARTAPR